MKLRLNFALFLTLFLTQSARPDCQTTLVRVLEEWDAVSYTAIKNVNPSPKYFNMDAPAHWKLPFRKVREALREKLQYLHNHPYTAYGIDIAPTASFWASRPFEKPVTETKPPVVEVSTLKEKENEPEKPKEKDNKDNKDAEDTFSTAVKVEKDNKVKEDKPVKKLDAKDAEEITATINGHLNSVENFTRDLEKLLDDAANNELRIAAILKALNDAKRNFDLAIDYTEYERVDGKLVPKTVSIDGRTKVGLMLDLKSLREKRLALEDRLAERTFDQAVQIKKLETYRAELKYYMAKNKGMPLPKDYEAILNRINLLYSKEDPTMIKNSVRPPTWAWERLKNLQLVEELKSVMQNDIVHLAKKIKDKDDKVKKAIDYVKSLPEEERKALGVENLATNEGRMRIARLFWSIAGSSVGLSGTVFSKTIIKFIFESRDERTKCAQIDDEKEFLQCCEDYLRKKFPKDFELARLNLKKLFNSDGHVTDPKLEAEISLLAAARQVKYKDKDLSKSTQKAIEDSVNDSTDR